VPELLLRFLRLVCEVHALRLCPPLGGVAVLSSLLLVGRGLLPTKPGQSPLARTPEGRADRLQGEGTPSRAMRSSSLPSEAANLIMMKYKEDFIGVNTVDPYVRCTGKAIMTSAVRLGIWLKTVVKDRSLCQLLSLIRQHCF